MTAPTTATTTATASPAAPRPAATRASASSSTLKTLAVVAGAILYIGAGACACLSAAGAIFHVAAHRQPPPSVEPGRFVELWRASEGDEHARRKLKGSLAVPALLIFMIVPVALATAGGRRRELHGSARFARQPEIVQAGLLTGADGIVLGRLGSRYLTLPGQQSVLLSAPTRSGKGVGIVIPNLLAWPDSVVVVDIKGENHKITAGYRASCGQPVLLWAPFAEDDRSHRWNPLAAIRNDARHTVGDILAIGQVMYPTEARGSGTEAFFAEQAKNLFLGLVLYLVETPDLPRTFGELLRQASGKGRSLKEHLQTLIEDRAASDRPLSETCTDALNRFLGTSENTLASILATFNAPLTVFAEPFVDAVTAGTDIDLALLRRRRMSVYVVIPPNRLADAAVLLNLFFSQAINLNTRTLPQDDPRLKHQALLLLDEATAMGRIGILAKAVGYLAGYNLRLLTVIQAVSQLDDVYGKDAARTFATNHAAQILYAPREQRDADEYSAMLGTFTERSESQGASSSSSAKGGSSSRSRNISPQRRALLLPQEFKELGSDKEVLVVENCKPILADKIVYWRDPVMMARLLPAPQAPAIDLELHRARVERRVRPAEEGERFTLEQLAGDFGRLPALGPGAGEDEVRGWVDLFFDSGAVAITPARPARPTEATARSQHVVRPTTAGDDERTLSPRGSRDEPPLARPVAD